MTANRSVLDDQTHPFNKNHQLSELGRPIATNWQTLLEELNNPKPRKPDKHATAFVSSLGRAVGFIDFTPAGLPGIGKDFISERHVKFTSDIPKALGQTVHVYVFGNSRFGIQDYQHLVGVLSNIGLGYRIFIVIVPGHTPDTKSKARQEQTGVVVIDYDDVVEMATNPQPSKIFYRIVRKQIPNDLIQPYSHIGAVRPSMFFGRRTELAQILLYADKSYAIFGGRRSGKTSLLTKLVRDLTQDSSNKPVFFSAQGVNNIADFCRRLLRSVRGAVVEPQTSGRGFDLERMRSDLKREILITGKRVIILVDEIDDLVKLDQFGGERVMSMLRSLTEDLPDRCRFIFAGFGRLYDRLVYYHSPVMNFLIPFALGGLDSKAARQLIEVPFSDYLGYDVKPEVVNMILDYSSRSAWQIQYFCARLAQLLAEEEKDNITNQDVQRVFEDFTFRSEVVETVLANLSSEQMAILCMFLDSPPFSREDVYRSFQRGQILVELGFLGRQLDQMVKFGVFSPPSKGENTFSFSYAHLPAIINEVEVPRRLFDQAKMEIKKRYKGSRR